MNIERKNKILGILQVGILNIKENENKTYMTVDW